MLTGHATEDTKPSGPAKSANHLADREFWMSPLNLGLRAEDRRVVGPRRRKVCIYGAGLYKEEALPILSDPSWEVWALNLIPPLDSCGRLRADIWFDLHQRKAQTADDLRWIAKCPVPIYVPPDLEDASPNAVHFPLAEIERQFGSYWSCTFAYQIALAMLGGAEAIGLYGVELMYGTDRERTVEWACVSYWLGRAEERGIDFFMPQNSLLGCHPSRYGFEYAEELNDVRGYTDLMAQGDEWRRKYKGGVDAGG